MRIKTSPIGHLISLPSARVKSLLRIWADPELIESGSWNHAKNGACIRNKVKLLPMSLVAWITDLYSYFCDSHSTRLYQYKHSAATSSKVKPDGE